MGLPQNGGMQCLPIHTSNEVWESIVIFFTGKWFRRAPSTSRETEASLSRAPFEGQQRTAVSCCHKRRLHLINRANFEIKTVKVITSAAFVCTIYHITTEGLFGFATAAQQTHIAFEKNSYKVTPLKFVIGYLTLIDMKEGQSETSPNVSKVNSDWLASCVEHRDDGCIQSCPIHRRATVTSRFSNNNRV